MVGTGDHVHRTGEQAGTQEQQKGHWHGSNPTSLAEAVSPRKPRDPTSAAF